VHPIYQAPVIEQPFSEAFEGNKIQRLRQHKGGAVADVKPQYQLQTSSIDATSLVVSMGGTPCARSATIPVSRASNSSTFHTG